MLNILIRRALLLAVLSISLLHHSLVYSETKNYKEYSTDFKGNVIWLYPDPVGCKSFWVVDRIDKEARNSDEYKALLKEWNINDNDALSEIYSQAVLKDNNGRTLKEMLLKDDHPIEIRFYDLSGKAKYFMKASQYLQKSPLKEQPIDEILESDKNITSKEGYRKELDEFEQQVEKEFKFQDDTDEKQNYSTETIEYYYTPGDNSDNYFKRIEITYDSDKRKLTEVVYDKEFDEKIFYLYKYINDYSYLRISLVHIKNFVRGKRYPFGREGTPKFTELKEFHYNDDYKLKQETFYTLRKQKTKSCSYKYDDNGNLTNLSIEDFLFSKSKSISMKYNSNGKLLSKKFIDNKKALVKKDTYKYDENGNLTFEKHFKPGNVLVDSIKYSYDENGNNPSKIFYKGKNNIIKKTKSKNSDDPLGTITLEFEYTPDNKLVMIHQYRQDSNNHIIEDAMFDQKRKFQGMIKYNYNDDMLLVEELRFDGKGYLYFLQRRYYDDMNRNVGIMEQYFTSPNGVLQKTLGFYVDEFEEPANHYFLDNFKETVNYTVDEFGIRYINYSNGKLDQVQVYNDQDLLVRIKEKHIDTSFDLSSSDFRFNK